MPPPCNHNPPRLPDPYDPGKPWCRLCELYATSDAYRALWGGPAPQPEMPAEGRRSLPCLFLGPVLDRLDCPCPGKWVRRCEVHTVCTLTACKTCADYLPN